MRSLEKVSFTTYTVFILKINHILVTLNWSNSSFMHLAQGKFLWIGGVSTTGWSLQGALSGGDLTNLASYSVWTGYKFNRFKNNVYNTPIKSMLKLKSREK